MTREEAIKWLKAISTKTVIFGWDDYALQESQKEIRERCEKAFGEAIDMAIEALSADTVATIQTGQTYGKSAYIKELAEVVRCKNCKYCWYDDDTESLECRHNKGLNEEIYGNDFCCYGERREP